MGRREKDATRIAHDVRAGATDTFVMEKYELSREELYSYYDDLVKEGRLAMSDLLGDLPPAPEPGLMLVEECPVCGTHNLVDTERCTSCGSTLPRRDGKISETEQPRTATVGMGADRETKSCGDEITESAGTSPVVQEKDISLVGEDATMDLQTVLDDFSGFETRAGQTDNGHDASWAVTTSGQDILEVIESVPIYSTGKEPPQKKPLDEFTDSMTVQTELSLEELLDLASEFDATGNADENVGEERFLDLELDRTIAAVRRENLHRKKRKNHRIEKQESEESEATADGLITLSSEIEIPEGREPTESGVEDEFTLDFQMHKNLSEYESEDDSSSGFPDGTVTEEVAPITDVDIRFIEPSASGDVPKHDTLPDDDVDLDFTTVSEFKKVKAAAMVSSDEQPVHLEPTESEFTFNLDDSEDVQPLQAEELVEPDPHGPVAEQDR